MLELSNNKMAYTYYVEHFLPIVIGKKNLPGCKLKQLAQSRLDELATPTDEAFGLLALHNAWDCWNSLKEKNAKGEKIDKSKLKYSCGSGTYAKKYCGWNEEGMRKYTQLVQNVRNDRSSIQRKELQNHITDTFREKHDASLDNADKMNEESLISNEDIIAGWKNMRDLEL